MYKSIFDSPFAQLLAIENVHILVVRDNVVVGLFLSEKVYNQVVGNARNPGRELTVLGIATLLDGHNGFDKGFLKDVVGQFLVFDNIKNVVESTSLMTFEQYIKSFIITFGIQCNQLFVGAIE